MEKLNFITIEELATIKSEYTIKALNEYQETETVSKRTDQILWYASKAILDYSEFGKSPYIAKAIKKYYNTVGELELMLRGNWGKEEA